MFGNERFSTIEEYAKLYDDIVSMSMDWDMVTEEDENSAERLKKATYVYAMYKCLADVPMSHVEYWFKKKRKIDLDKLIDNF